MAFIQSLTIECFRGVGTPRVTTFPEGELPHRPGDAGKSTILSAIEMVLHPRATPTTSEYDPYRRRIEQGS